MKITALKNILKEVNEPNEYLMTPFELSHPLYWIFKLNNVRVKTLFSKLDDVRKPSARFDVFFNGQYIGENDYKFEQKENDFYIKFIRSKFPTYDADGFVFLFYAPEVFDSIPEGVRNPSQTTPDEIKIKGDIETF